MNFCNRCGDPTEDNKKLCKSGLDRIDSSGHYTLENVNRCCKFCNIAKGSMTVHEFKDLVSSIYGNWVGGGLSR